MDLFQQFHVVEQWDKCHEIRIWNFLTLTTTSNLTAKAKTESFRISGTVLSIQTLRFVWNKMNSPATSRPNYMAQSLPCNCQEPGPAPEPYIRQSSTGYMYLSDRDERHTAGDWADSHWSHQDLIGCSETRTVCAQSVLSTCIPCTQLFTGVQFSSCAVNKPLLNAILTLTPSSDWKFAGSIPGSSTVRLQPWASCSHTCLSQFGTGTAMWWHMSGKIASH